MLRFRFVVILLTAVAVALSASAQRVDASVTRARLTPGEALTFLSDGVVEAQSPSGELFGFVRAANISNQSAEQIAHAPQQFGQEDDITVLTLTFAPVEVLHA